MLRTSTVRSRPARPSIPCPVALFMRLEQVLLNLLSDATPSRIERLRAMGTQEYLAKALDVARVIDLMRDHLRGHEPTTMQGGCTP